MVAKDDGVSCVEAPVLADVYPKEEDSDSSSSFSDKTSSPPDDPGEKREKTMDMYKKTRRPRKKKQYFNVSMGGPHFEPLDKVGFRNMPLNADRFDNSCPPPMVRQRAAQMYLYYLARPLINKTHPSNSIPWCPISPPGQSTLDSYLNRLHHSCLMFTVNPWQLTEKQLKDLNFPRPHLQEPGRAVLYNLKHRFLSIAPSAEERNCSRCGCIYGVYNNSGPCRYHSARLSAGSEYPCCQRGSPYDTCCSALKHVSNDIDPDNLRGFVNTWEEGKGKMGVYSLDAEMVYTTKGMEVAAVTLVDAHCEVIYETLILPENPVLDYNTRHSHLKNSDFINVTTRLKDVQEVLLSYLGRSTILVGHSVHHDLLSLHMIHNTVVDTSIVFPHPAGQNCLRSLKGLKDEYIRMQPEDCYPQVKCTTDAINTMRLILLKVFLQNNGYLM